ncbi:MAG TPA: glucose 1-dehydrogenase [Stellaceae bacterium]|nr:glucose 1-dehydrogenase [Stellaceae bacterium]
MAALDGKVAVVAGGSSGIGARIAELFVAEGAAVAIASPFVEEGEALAATLGAKACFIRTDVTDEAQVEALVAAAVARFGRLDCMVNNAGIAGRFSGIAALDTAQHERTLAVVLRGVVLGTKHAAAVMQRQGQGSIINTGSVAGSRAGYGPYDYSAAKAAVIHFTRCVAMELAEKGVRANSVSPGGIVTGIFGKSIDLPAGEIPKTLTPLAGALAKWQPIPRAGAPDDIAQAVLFLASDAASFITGHDLVVDGGLVAGRSWTAQKAATAELMSAMRTR